jgi:HSP20 family protein
MATNQKNAEQKQSRPAQSSKREITPTERRSPLARGRSPLMRLRTEFDRLFDEFFGGWPSLSTWPEEPAQRWGFDIEDEADKVIVRAEAPGFEPQDFNLQVHDNQLELCACQTEESSQDGGRQWHKQELYRSIPLPSGIDPEHVDAQYRNGILTVTVPKTEQGKGHKIEVKG